MKRAGVVDVYCNIHPDMIAKVKILDNGFYTITDGRRAVPIDGVPPGRRIRSSRGCRRATRRRAR